MIVDFSIFVLEYIQKADVAMERQIFFKCSSG